jgi:cobalamin biosynthesis protein CobD/CbiB
MQILSLIWGILAFVGFFIALLPCLGSINWLNIPFAFIGLIISIIATTTAPPESKKTNSIVGIVLCGIAVLIGLIRLIAGGGVV